jgi:hypothetical protein
MLNSCFIQMLPFEGPSTSGSASSDIPVEVPPRWEIHIPPPDDNPRDATLQWHIATRNFFAFLFKKPLIGSHLGAAFVDLQDRIQLFRGAQSDSFADFLEYADDQGYRDYPDCPNHALAMLYYAEHYRLRDVWVDAWVHCVGMNDSLVLSTEFQAISNVSKALITRAYLEMDIHLGRVTVALTQFLEDDMSPARLGLSPSARSHLDRFRSFLHSCLVEKFGYWPPMTGSNFSRTVFRSMYYDFQQLYEYLVDRESTDSISGRNPANGGMCVLQNVLAFDKRHNFAPLPHPLPLIPDYDVPQHKTASQRTLKAFKLGSKRGKATKYVTMRAALTAATNTSDSAVMECALVKEYMRFERLCALNTKDEKLSLADSRKVRWLLIYGMLQYLISAIGVPKEVRNTDEPTYPLCCLITSMPPWQAPPTSPNSPTIALKDIPKADTRSSAFPPRDTADEVKPEVFNPTIEPDCATEDYLAHTNSHSSTGTRRCVEVETPEPLRIPSPVRNMSSPSKRLSQLSSNSPRHSVSSKVTASPQCESFGGDDGSRHSINLVHSPSFPQSKRSSVSAILDGANVQETSWFCSSTLSLRKEESHASRPTSLEVVTTRSIPRSRTPIFDSSEMEHLIGDDICPVIDESPTSSTTSTALTGLWSSASTNSTSSSSYPEMGICPEPNDDDFKNTPNGNSIEASGLLGGFVAVPTSPPSSPKKQRASLNSLHYRSSSSRASNNRSPRSPILSAFRRSVSLSEDGRRSISPPLSPSLFPKPPSSPHPMWQPRHETTVSDEENYSCAVALNSDPRSPCITLETDGLTPFVPSQMNPNEKEIVRDSFADTLQDNACSAPVAGIEKEKEQKKDNKKSWAFPSGSGLSRGMGSLLRRKEKSG